MLRPSKVLARVLIAVSVAAVFPVIVSASSGPASHGAVCHHEFPVVPTPSNRSHQCCMSGHQWAVPGSSLMLRPVAAEAAGHNESCELTALLPGDYTFTFLSDSPPVITLLRI